MTSAITRRRRLRRPSAGRDQLVSRDHTGRGRCEQPLDRALTDGADFLVDGTDNFETRYLINDLAVKTRSCRGSMAG